MSLLRPVNQIQKGTWLVRCTEHEVPECQEKILHRLSVVAHVVNRVSIAISIEPGLEIQWQLPHGKIRDNHNLIIRHLVQLGHIHVGDQQLTYEDEVGQEPRSEDVHHELKCEADGSHSEVDIDHVEEKSCRVIVSSRDR